MQEKVIIRPDTRMWPVRQSKQGMVIDENIIGEPGLEEPSLGRMVSGVVLILK